MKYPELAKLYYADTSSSRDTAAARELEARLLADSTFRLGFETPVGELFIACPRELSVLNEQVLRTEREVSSLINDLPPLAAHAALRGLVLDEVVSTNAIEDIHSTRRQVKDALNTLPYRTSGTKRFRELATLYLNIIDGTHIPLDTLEDLRAVYDEVTRGEIPADKQPDSQLFRATGVDIVQGGTRIVHSGLEPEGKIQEALKVMLATAKRADIPSLYRSIAAHYLFEYVHPFYDGNGRTGRFLLSLMLSDTLSAATALSLSRTIAEHRDAYYRAFKTTEKALNHGELTFFVHAMLTLIHQAQLSIAETLAGNVNLFEHMREQFKQARALHQLKPQEANIVFMLMQYEAFGLLGDAPLADIARHLGLKEQMTRKHLAALEGRGIVTKHRQRRPLTFALTTAFKERYHITGTRQGGLAE